MASDQLSDAESDRETAETIEEAIVERRRVDQAERPNHRFVDSVTLYRSNRKSVEAVHMEIIDQRTGQVHHHAVKLEQTNRMTRAAGGGWTIRTPITIWIDDEQGDAIGSLRDFLSVARDQLPEDTGDFLITRVDGTGVDAESISRLIAAASLDGKIQSLIEVIESVSGDPEGIELLAQLAQSHPDVLEVAAAALNLGRYQDAIATLEGLIEEGAQEGEFQSHLSKNPGIFGSDYSELHPRRVWVRDQEKDFMLRRAADGFLEIVEIKTPLRADQQLFRFDDSHRSYYPRSELSKTVAQVMSYLEGVDQNQALIYMNDNERVQKITARVVIGRDHDAEQVEALRTFNSHLNRIEVLTYDQLLRIGKQVIEHVKGVVGPLQQ